MQITGEFSLLPLFSQNRLLFSSQESKSVEEIIQDAFARDLDILLCQDMNKLPTDFTASNSTYICDDRIILQVKQQRQLELLRSRITYSDLQNLKNNPSSGECCTWSNHQTKCGECRDDMNYIGLTKGKCSWDRASGEIYEYVSNDGQKYDTCFCDIKASFNEGNVLQ